jgi:diaminopimelate epimerase
MNISFTKMHGLGNDFVVINNMAKNITLSNDQIIFLCDRHKGIGADGVILVESSSQADCFMNYYNSDGTIASMCGNGIRCTAKFFKDEILDKNKKQENFKIETRAGIKEIQDLSLDMYAVNMGKPIFVHEDFPNTPMQFEDLSLNFVSVGNPHAVIFVDDIDKYNISVLGSKIENHKNFPNKINVEFVQEVSPVEFKLKVWERGCGLTMACGTGATAVYALLRKQRDVSKDISIDLPGGKLFFSENVDGDIIMRGQAESVFTGIIKI